MSNVGRHMSPYRFEIELFLGHFKEQAEAIAKVASPFHRKTLYAAAFDPLARAAYGATGTHRERFVRLLRDCSGWQDAEKVSLPQLQLRLRDTKRSRYKLYRETSRRLNLWPQGQTVSLSSCPSLAELAPLAASNEQLQLKDSQYVQLFYTHRNNLVHEFREPGYGTDWSGRSTAPFYGSSIYGPWELVFPVVFVASLYESTLQGLEAHLLRSKTNPYKQFQFGSLWRAK
jgi:hypothetical protein